MQRSSHGQLQRATPMPGCRRSSRRPIPDGRGPAASCPPHVLQTSPSHGQSYCGPARPGQPSPSVLTKVPAVRQDQSGSKVLATRSEAPLIRDGSFMDPLDGGPDDRSACGTDSVSIGLTAEIVVREPSSVVLGVVRSDHRGRHPACVGNLHPLRASPRADGVGLPRGSDVMRL